MSYNDYDEDQFTLDMIMREPEFNSIPKKENPVANILGEKKINLFSNGKSRLKKKGKIILKKKKEKSSSKYQGYVLFL